MKHLAEEDLEKLSKEKFPILQQAFKGIEKESKDIKIAYELLEEQVKELGQKDFSKNTFVITAESLTKEIKACMESEEEISEKFQSLLGLSENFSAKARSIISSP